jgi:DNA mismatch repair protein MutS2
LIYPVNFEEKTGFNKIRELLKSHCLSTLGKQKVDDITFSTAFDEIIPALSLTSEFKEICLFEEGFPVSFYFDVRPSLSKLKIDGTYMVAEELFDLKRSLDSISAIIRFFKNVKEEKYPFLRELSKEIIVYPRVIDKINSIINVYGQIKDNASRELADIRKSLSQKQAGVSKVMHHLLKKAQSEGWVEPDTSLTIRDGKMLIPIPSGFKRKIKGLVYDESATGKTSFIEPLEIVEINNEIRELEFAERREIMKILIDLANFLRPDLDELLNAYEFLGKIDFIRSKALFAI